MHWCTSQTCGARGLAKRWWNSYTEGVVTAYLLKHRRITSHTGLEVTNITKTPTPGTSERLLELRREYDPSGDWRYHATSETPQWKRSLVGQRSLSSGFYSPQVDSPSEFSWVFSFVLYVACSSQASFVLWTSDWLGSHSKSIRKRWNLEKSRCQKDALWMNYDNSLSTLIMKSSSWVNKEYSTPFWSNIYHKRRRAAWRVTFTLLVFFDMGRTAPWCDTTTLKHYSGLTFYRYSVFVFQRFNALMFKHFEVLTLLLWRAVIPL